MKGKARFLILLCVLFLCVERLQASPHTQLPEPANPSKIIYVDDNADGFNLGTSWENAVNSLQDALLLAYFHDKPVEIHVAEGVYTPDRGLGIMPGDRSASFELINGVTIKGGYTATRGHRGGQALDVRDVNQYRSILSGDLNSDDRPDINNIEDNSYHVVTSSGADETAVLDGFTITGSGIPNGRAVHNIHSGGMYNNDSSPTLIDCTFSENLAAEVGAGMYNNNSNPVLFNCMFSENNAPEGGSGMYNENSSPTLTDCTFVENITGGGGTGMYNVNSNPILLNCTFIGNIAYRGGGGMYNDHSSPMITNCMFSENWVRNDGGGMYNEESSPMLADCVFRRNTAIGGGGGIFNRMSSSTLLNCEFTGNSAEDNGGGISDDASSPTLTNCTFTENSAIQGGAINCFDSSTLIVNNTIVDNMATGSRASGFGGGICCYMSSPTVVNTILWNNIPDEIYESDEIYEPRGGSGRVPTPASAIVTYSNVQGGFTGEGNIDVEPMFANLENGDYHLKSQAGRWDPAAQNWVIDDISSLCIDAGKPGDPVGLERFPNGGRINMGAYGGTPEASLTPRQLIFLLGQASNPNPADGAVDVGISVRFSWTAGRNAASHDVYLGADRDAVANADTSDTTGIYQGRQSATTYYPPEGIIGGSIVTYYWRIDEVGSDDEIVTGAVWTFTTVAAPPPKGRACFLPATPVWIDGNLVQISKVAIGQTVGRVACLTDTTMQIEKLQEHEGTYECYDVLLESGNCISVAECHYFLTESGRWIALQNLRAGTKLQTSKGSVEISSVTKRPMLHTGKVYNIKVKGSDRYLVGKDAIIVRDY
ncbi:MAG: hypothetical protein PVH77_04205 [Phycisphaerales bacterium]|jgi:predicted outer membrane repeat protein